MFHPRHLNLPLPILRDVGPIINTPSTCRCMKSSCTCPSPFQRDVGGAFSLDEGFGEANTQRETQDVGFPEGVSRKWTMTFIMVCFPESLHSHTDVYNSKVNPATMTRRSNDESETVATMATFNDDDDNVYRWWQCLMTAMPTMLTTITSNLEPPPHCLPLPSSEGCGLVLTSPSGECPHTPLPHIWWFFPFDWWMDFQFEGENTKRGTQELGGLAGVHQNESLYFVVRFRPPSLIPLSTDMLSTALRCRARAGTAM